MAEVLTAQQHLAVHDRGGKLLVSAAAGSGKTKVLVDRILRYLTDPADPANLDEFLIITYTKAAASELRGKIAAKLTEKIAQQPENKHLQKQMQRLFLTKISTVHSFCADILREYAYKLDLAPDFRVADESECRELRNQVMSDLLDEAYQAIGEEPDILSFVDTQGLGRDDRFVPEILEKVFDSARCHLNPAEWLERCLTQTDLKEGEDLSQTIWGSYLLQDLQEYVTIQIKIFQECISQMQNSENMDKPIQNISSILNQLESLLLAATWDEVVSSPKIDYGRLTFPRKNVDTDLAERVKAVRNACKKGLERKLGCFSENAQTVRRDLLLSVPSLRGLVKLVKEFEKSFTAAKRSRRVLDFSDLEHRTLDLLLGKARSNPTSAAFEIGERYREILVDEYQDSNGVQDAIFEVLTRKSQNCFMVGDVKQSIYQFRLADPGIFLDKYETFSDASLAAPGQGRRVLLSHNFRSGPEIINCVNSVFLATMRKKVGGLQYGEEEALREGIPHEVLPDQAVELYALDIQEDTYSEEATFVAERIKNMLQEGCLIRKNGTLQPVKPEDIVILLRSPGSAAVYFQKALEMQGIRCTTGAGDDLLKSEEICTLRALLQVIMNPRLDIPLISLLSSPVFCFTANDLAMIRGNQKKGSFYDALCSSEHEKAFSFLNALKSLRKEAKMCTITSLLALCFRITKIDSIYGAMPDGDLKAANLQMFYQLAVDFEKQSLKDLPQFLDYLESVEDRGLVASGNHHQDAVTIMSIHKSKGLEFPVVFLCNLSRRFNMESLRATILCDKSLGLGFSVSSPQNRIRYPSIAKRAISVKMTAETVSEEMRVLYVAMTRAKDRLVMTYASRTLEADLKEIVLRQDFDNGELICREATCMGDWVLLAALQRVESGMLHALAGKPKQSSVYDHPWKVVVCQAPTQTVSLQEKHQSSQPISNELLSKMQENLNYQYPYITATLTPSKQTATDRKGRDLDLEVAENTQDPPNIVRKWRRPVFLPQKTSGKEYGNLMHTVMQYISYEKCTDSMGIETELSRLIDKGFLTVEQRAAIDVKKIQLFFDSDIGQKLCNGVPYLREFKFSILDDGICYDQGLATEKILLQGVADCALLEKDGITVIDFKTDYVTDETLPAVISRYRSQLKTYSEALSRIYEMPVKARYLYLFHLDLFAAV